MKTNDEAKPMKMNLHLTADNLNDILARGVVVCLIATRGVYSNPKRYWVYQWVSAFCFYITFCSNYIMTHAKSADITANMEAQGFQNFFAMCYLQLSFVNVMPFYSTLNWLDLLPSTQINISRYSPSNFFNSHLKWQLTSSYPLGVEMYTHLNIFKNV